MALLAGDYCKQSWKMSLLFSSAVSTPKCKCLYILGQYFSILNDPWIAKIFPWSGRISSVSI